LDTITAGVQETTRVAHRAALPNEVLFEGCLSPQVKITLQQVATLAEDNPRHTTPPLTFPRLADLTRLSASTLRGHLAILRAYRSAIRLQRAGRGCFTLVLANWLFLPLPCLPEERIPQPVPQNISPVRTGPAIPAGRPTPSEPAGSLPVSPPTGSDSFPPETALSERNETTTGADAIDPSPL
jgi:hypothetical protein